jgi:uncharacterized coiled-coil DUF342 family protein
MKAASWRNQTMSEKVDWDWTKLVVGAERAVQRISDLEAENERYLARIKELTQKCDEFYADSKRLDRLRQRIDELASTYINYEQPNDCYILLRELQAKLEEPDHE